MNRALRAAAVSVLLFSPVALSACSAGQISQTATQVRDKTGAIASIGALELRQIELAYPTGGRYDRGDDAVLHMSIVNTGSEADTLRDISGDAFDSFRITGSPSGTASATPTSTAASATAGSGSGIVIPAGATVFLGENAPTVTLVGLTESLTAAQSIQLKLRFEKAGEVTVQAIVSPATAQLPRTTTYNFENHADTGAESGNEVGGGGNG